MKKIIILTVLFTSFVLFAPAQARALEPTYVFDSETYTYYPLEEDPTLTFLAGHPPVEEDLQEGDPSFDDQLVSAHVVNGEDWHQVNGKKFPYSALTYVQTGTEQCSGSMVGRYAMLTAAHCVYAAGKLVNPANIKVHAGGKNSSIRASGKQIFVLNGYSQDKDKGFDYAIVILNSPVGDKSGYLGFKETKLQASKQIRVLGFPSVKPANNPWQSPGKITQVFENKFLFAHDADTTPGSSGSPILEPKDNSVIAVHTAQSTNDKKVFNLGVCSKRLMTFIKEHRDKH